MAKDEFFGSLEGKILFSDFQMVEVTMTDDAGCKIKKVISLEDYVSILTSQKSNWEEIPRMPAGTVKTKWRDDKNYSVAIYVPKDVRPTIFLKNEKPLMIPYPNLVFFFSIQRGTVYQSTVFAVKESISELADDSRLCRFPYGNVSTSDGKICWGGNSITTVKEPAMLEKCIGLFFDAPMNTDLYRASVSIKIPKPLEDVLAEMNGKNEFGNENLQENGMLFGSLFKS